MIVTLDLPSHLAGRVEADARAQNRPIVDLLLDAVADRWENGSIEGEDEVGFPNNVYERFPLPPLLREPLSEALRAGFADSDAGRVTEGEAALAELRRYVGRE